MLDILLKNGRVVDGTGNPWYKIDLGISDGKIIGMSKGVSVDSEIVIDASGLVISPGFIDLHTHTDRTILKNNRAISSVMAGVTTEGIGNCGSSVYGITSEYMKMLKESSPDEEIDWTDLKDFRKKVNSKRIGINLAPFIGHNTVRTSVLGPEGKGGEKVLVSEEEMADMKTLVEKAMEQGAFGLTTGLRYAPGRNALTSEIIELLKVVNRYGGVYMSHLRGESETLIESVNEFIKTCKESKVRGCISHHKATLPENWGKPVTTVRLLEEARLNGIDVMCDMYPWNFSSAANIGRWFINGMGRNPGLEGHYKPSTNDVKNFLNDLENPDLWKIIKKETVERFEVDFARFNERRVTLEKHGITPSKVYNPKNFEAVTYSKNHPELVGKRFFEVANILKMDDYLEAIKKLLLDDEGLTYTAGGGMCDEDIFTILRFPSCAISTDGSTRDGPSTAMKPSHPRNYGSFAKILHKYVREKRVLSLEEAIRKMTSLPANFLGLSDRGIIKPGAWADLVIFDFKLIENKATFAHPDRYPEGIEYVIINGEISVEKGVRTNNLSGKVLKY